jgi:hypothetical protein
MNKNFRPVLDTIDGQTAEEELKAIDKWLNIKNDQDPTFSHLIRTLEPCWCDTGALAAFRNGSNLTFDFVAKA